MDSADPGTASMSAEDMEGGGEKKVPMAWGEKTNDELSQEVKKRRSANLREAKEKHGRGEKDTRRYDGTGGIKRPGADGNGETAKAGGGDENKLVSDTQRKGEVKEYSWWSEERCIAKNVPEITTSTKKPADAPPESEYGADQAGDIVMSEPDSAKELANILEACDVDATRFGQNEAKSLEALLRELKLHECRLLLRDNRVIRVVDLIVLRIQSTNGKFLVERNQIFADGRERSVTRLPAVMRRAESTGVGSIHTGVARLLKSELNTTSDVIIVAMDHLEDPMQEVVHLAKGSQSYPGLSTVYRKHFYEASVSPKAAKADLDSLGLPDEVSFKTKLADGTASVWEWWDRAQCESQNLRVTSKIEVAPEFLGLKPLHQKPWNPANLSEILQRHGIDTNLFGTGKARSLQQFCDELESGESRLFEKPGELRRYLEILILKVRNTITNAFLIETGHAFSGAAGNAQQRSRQVLPATKVRPFEDKVWAVRRLMGEVKIPYSPSTKICFGPRRIEQSMSPSYPNIVTVYIKQVVSVDLAAVSVAGIERGEAWRQWLATQDDPLSRRGSKASIP
eukprot:gnl/TRDRNA2_/TRDRNA2_156327_c1_seq1.p1 gnl/TRDRNA2_/TRDRNA2_156327_c1~~gnl/TRDRNA2_/TRDRNA2_156327_c1_seq1.p1  ORF type:complete len:637 (+),score=138.83 gnl/TRDRNA2_/TRDRNA2_156327_c1_seq1:208-1911(+)